MNAVTKTSSLKAALRGLLHPRAGLPASLTAGVLSVLAAPAALADPTGGVVVDGDATINQQGNGTTINQTTQRAIIDWDTFNIGIDEYVIFNQLGSSSVILNRVIGGDPSTILGNLTANGHVFLVNPNGVFFGESAMLDVGGLLATTLDISNADFMAGNYHFENTDNSHGEVINAGRITARDGGFVVLAGDKVENTGVIAARAGHVVLAAGRAITLDVEGDGLVNFAVDEATLSDLAGVHNAGQILADGGLVLMTAKVASALVTTAVNNEGLIQAHGISEAQDGTILLTAEGADIVNSGELDADGINGQDGGVVYIHGNENIDLKNGSVITAAGNGTASGGTVRVIAEDTLLFRENATIRATGGDANGGFVEVSGYEGLLLRGQADIGSGGSFLIDPFRLTIRAGSGTGTFSGSTTSGSLTSVGSAYITSQLDLGVNVHLVATDSVTASGGVSALNATGAGDLFIGIGSITGATGSICAFGVCTGTGTPTFNNGTGGTINLSGVDINIGGDFTASALLGNVNLGSVTANIITIIGADTITTSDLAATGASTVTAAIELDAQSGITVNGTVTASNGSINISNGATGDINITGSSGGLAISASGEIFITAQNGDVTIGSGVYSDLTFIGRRVTSTIHQINITADNIYTGALSAGSNITLTASPSAGGGGADARIFVGSNAASIDTFADITASGDITLTATGAAFGSPGSTGNAFIQAGNIDGILVTLRTTGAATASGNPIASIDVANITGDVIDITANDIFTDNLNANGANTAGFGVDIQTTGDDAAIRIVGTIITTGGGVSLSASNGDINVLGSSAGMAIDAAGDIKITATGSFGGSIDVVGNVIAGGTVDMLANGDNFNDINVNGSISAASVTLENLNNSGDVRVRGNSITGAGITATTGDITISATSGAVYIADSAGEGGSSFGRSITAAGNLEINAEDEIVTGEINAGGNVLLDVFSSYGNRILVGSFTSGSPSDIYTYANITAGGSVQLTASGGSGFASSVQIAAGNISGTVVNVQATNNDTGGGDATIQLGNVTATAGNIQLRAQNNGSGTNDTGSAVIDTGNLNAAGSVLLEALADSSASIGGYITTGTITGTDITVNHDGNQADISLGALSASDTAGPALISVITGDDFSVTQAGDITINGDITVQGIASTACSIFSGCLSRFNQPLAAGVTLQTGDGGSTGLGNVTVNGTVDITANVTNVNVTNQYDGAIATLTGTAGLADLHIRGATASISGSLIMQGADVNALIEANTVNIGAVQLTATGHNTILNYGPSSGTGSLTSSNNAGNAVMRIQGIGSGGSSGAPAANSVTLGAVTINGVGNAGLFIASQVTNLTSVSVTATAATYNRTLTGFLSNTYLESVGPFNSNFSGNQNNTNNDLGLNEGTITIGNATMRLNGGTSCISSLCTELAANSLTATGNLSVSGVGVARFAAFATNINITGGLTATATAGNVVNGAGAGGFYSSGTGSTAGVYSIATTASGSFGSADVTLQTDTGSGASITVGGLIDISGPAAGLTVESSTGAINLGAVTITGSGENYHETNVYTFSGNPLPSGSTLPAFTTSFSGSRDDNAIAEFRGQTVTVNGDITVSGVGVVGAIIQGTTVSVGNVSITAGSASKTTLDTRVSPTAINFQRGDAILGITELGSSSSPILGATVTGNVTINSDINAHVGINADISGNLVVKATTGNIDTTMPSFLTEAPILPPLNVSASAVLFSAGGDILLSGATLNVGSGSTSFAGDSETATAAGLAPGYTPNAAFIAGGTLNMGVLSLTGNYLWMQANQFGTPGNIFLPSTALVQFTTFDTSHSMGLEATSAQTNLTALYLSNFSAANTLAFGDSSHIGDLLLAEAGEVNLSANNLIFATDGDVTGTNFVYGADVIFITDTLSNITAGLTTGTVDVTAGNNVDLILAGPAIFSFGTDTFGTVSLVTTGDLTLQSSLSATDVLLQANTGGIVLGTNTITATNITLDTDTTFTGSGLLTAGTLTLIGAATTDFDLVTDVATFNVQSGNDVLIENTSNPGAATVSYGTGTFGNVRLNTTGTLTLLSSLTATDIDLWGFGGLNLGSNTLTATNGIFLNTSGTFNGTGLLTANTLTLLGNPLNTNYNVVTDVAVFDIRDVHNVTIDNTAFTGAATATFNTGTYGIVDLTTGGTLDLLTNLTAADITLRGFTGLDLSTFTLTATNNILLDTGGTFTGTGQLTANTLTLAGGATTDFNVLTDVGSFNVQSGNNITIDNSAFTGDITLAFGAGTFGAVTGTFGGHAALLSAFNGASLDLTTLGQLQLGANTITASGTVSFDVGGTQANGTGLISAANLVLTGAANTDFTLITNTTNINVVSGFNLTLDNISNTGLTTLTFGSGTFGNIIGEFNDVLLASDLSAASLNLMSANLQLGLDRTITTSGDLILNASGAVSGTGLTNLNAANLTLGSGASYTFENLSVVTTADLNLGTGSITATGINGITLDVGGVFTGTGLITADSLTLIGAATTDFDVTTDINTLTVTSGRDVDVSDIGSLSATFGTGAFGNVSLATAGDLSLLSNLSATDILLQANTGFMNLAANALTATNSITLDTGTTFTGTGLLVAVTLNLVGGATTDFVLTTDVDVLNVISGNDINLNNLNILSASFADGTYGNVSLVTAGDLTLASGLSAADIMLQANSGAINLSTNTLTATNAVTLDADTTFTGTGLLTAATLNLVGGATTDFVLTSDVNTLTVIGGNNILLNNTGNLTAGFADGTYGSVSLITTGDLALQSGLSASDILLQANTGAINLSANTLTATNAITLDTDTGFTGTGLLTAATLNLIGGATTDFNILTNAGAFNVQSGDDVSIDNTAFTGTATLGFGAGSFGTLNAAFGGGVDLTSAFSGTGFALTTPGDLNLGTNSITATETVSFDIGGSATANGLITANSFVLIGETSTAYSFTTNAGDIQLESAGDITIDNTAHTGSAYVYFGPDTFNNIALTMGGNTGIGVASSLTANNAAIVVNNGSLDISNHTFDIAGSLAMVADGSVLMSGVNITAGTLTVNAGGDITDSGTIGSGGFTKQASGQLAPASITAGSVLLAADGDILLGQTTFTVGSGSIDGFAGDQVLLETLLSEGLITDTNGPNAVFAANGTVEIGDTSVAGGYLLVTAAAVNFTGNITGPSDLLVQLVPFGGTGQVSLENSASTGSGLNLDDQDMSAIQDGATIALGFSGYAGNVTLGQNGTVDIGAQNLIVATSGDIDSVDNITTTGLVSSVESIISGNDEFDSPTTDELDLDTNDGAGTNDDEDEESEDTDGDGTPETGDEDSMIKHDTTEEGGVCKV